MSAPAEVLTPSSPRPLTGSWQIDPVHSGVEFAVTHLMISKVRGRFSDITGTVVSDGTPEGSRVEVQIGAASIDTHEAARDTHLRSADFFDVEKYPQLTFVSTGIRSKSPDEFHVTGDLRMHGVTKAIEFDVTSEGTGGDPWGGTRAGFSSTFTLDRRDFGLTWNQAIEAGGVLVSNAIKVNLDIQLTQKAS
ncbi:MAG: YceI family protein [Gemmatimonadota bacterium]|nr:YceI family protein [Gemmatimonadota bacterium]